MPGSHNFGGRNVIITDAVIAAVDVDHDVAPLIPCLDLPADLILIELLPTIGYSVVCH